MRGLVSTPMENQDQFLSGEITNHLFEERRIPFSGLDLAALNIQRGRDHGLRPYNEYRTACNLKKAQKFSDLSVEISADVIKRLRQVCENSRDNRFFMHSRMPWNSLIFLNEYVVNEHIIKIDQF